MKPQLDKKTGSVYFNKNSSNEIRITEWQGKLRVPSKPSGYNPFLLKRHFAQAAKMLKKLT